MPMENSGGFIRNHASSVLVCIALIVCTLRAEIILSGEQDGFYEKTEYLVTEDIVVKSGETLTFAPGSIIRFNQYTGIIVHGSLVCNGTQTEPIIFTSSKTRNTDIEDRKMPQPFDWNGIYAPSENAHVTMKNVDISYSTYALKLKHKSSTLLLHQLTYGENGTTGVTLGDSLIDIYDGEPLNMKHPQVETKEDKQDEKLDLAGSPSDEVSVPDIEIDKRVKEKKPRRKGLIITRVGLGALAAISAGAGVYSYLQLEHNYSKYREDKTEDENFKSYSESRKEYRENGQFFEKTTTASAIALGVAGAGLFLTIAF